MKRIWSDAELAEHWTLSDDEQALPVAGNASRRLGFFVLLKVFQYENSFPTERRAVSAVVIQAIAEQLRVNPAAFRDYNLDGRTAQRHRGQIREMLGWREAKTADATGLVAWLRQDVLPGSTDPEHAQSKALEWFRARRIETPSQGRLERYVASAIGLYEEDFFQGLYDRLPEATRAAIDELLGRDGEAGDPDPELQRPPGDVTGPLTLNELKGDPGRPSVDSLLREVDKLNCINEIGIPADMFKGVPPKEVENLRRTAATTPPSALRERKPIVRYALVAAFCWRRRREVIDGLVELLIQIVHRIGVKAERRVETEILSDVRRVRGKIQMLFRVAEVSVDQPAGVIEEVIYPLVGINNLRDLVKEYRSSGPAFRRTIHKVMRSSYSGHYRRMLSSLLDSLDFRSNNQLHRPVIEALDLLRKYQNSRLQYFPPEEHVPIDQVVPPKWREIVLDETKQGNERINRINYEICVLQSLRAGLKCKEIWVDGADRYRNPDEDLPADFPDRRDEYYEELEVPKEAKKFIETLKLDMEQALTQLNAGMPRNQGVKVNAAGPHRLIVSPVDQQEEPSAINDLKKEINRLWPTTSLLDILKEAEFRIDLTGHFTTAASREILDRETVQRRLLLCLFGLGTNTGIKRVLTGSEHDTYKELLYIRRRYITKEALRAAITKVVNATFAVRDSDLWGEGTTACASDSKKFGAWDQNLMTEWHIRYGGRGVMIYWHVERKSVCIYSQLKRCSSSEVAAAIEGVLRHCTDMEVEKNYVDTHGQSQVAFAFTYLLGYDLLPRLKAINKQTLYLPGPGMSGKFPNLEPILNRPINWDLIANQYDEMVKFATALRLGTADAESILRRFTKENVTHPTYAALNELGHAVKTVFLCRYLGSAELRQEIHEGLNVVENWNSANAFIFFGKSGEVSSNRLEDQELSVLALHLLQSSLVYVNTLMIQRVLSEPGWRRRMRVAERRALTPLIYLHVNPYGRFELDMTSRLPIDEPSAQGPEP